MIIRSSSLDHGMRTPITAYKSQIRSLMDCSGFNRKSTSLSLLWRNWWNDHTCSSLLLTCQSSSISCSLTLLMHSKVSTLLIRHLWTIHLETIPWIHCHHSVVLSIILYCRQLCELTFFCSHAREQTKSYNVIGDAFTSITRDREFHVNKLMFFYHPPFSFLVAKLISCYQLMTFTPWSMLSLLIPPK
jgi:hypothetical protein